MAHGADELFELEREAGAVSPGRHRAVTHRGLAEQGVRARQNNGTGSPGVLETSARCEFSSVL